MKTIIIQYLEAILANRATIEQIDADIFSGKLDYDQYLTQLGGDFFLDRDVGLCNNIGLQLTEEHHFTNLFYWFVKSHDLDPHYPVYHPSGNRFAYTKSCLPKWSGEYGNTRFQFVENFLNWLKECA
ncbi:hypothetical protein AVV29_gp057 [Vibrio phage phi 3]|uniref:Uncharacterized protein n=1 Tax=Vibrio phage phi 3 TaxID=1589298 RepID=A0A0B5H2R8_9CAUD|nr:hypothetical protein AVV29_gp009 [Vibrio phage phi 3]YP_009207619.1 hypothetical protein AVV29_gp057 [Vibrio phage phi 3]AJF40777.1 hypothetical protein SBVP3_0009 [Vibrio phage phi 3]AJF40921.1 hypothetical protein SBVP3_00154 [Vibrio phage phi 3]